MDDSTIRVVTRGAAAGVMAGVIQVTIGKAEDILLLPPWEDSNLAPRLVDRLGKMVGVSLPSSAEWALGTAFHFGYGAFWGASYAAVRERWPVHPAVGGTMMGGLIYGITFPRWGGAVQTGTERPPQVRTSRMTFVAASVTFGFGLATAYLYERIR